MLHIVMCVPTSYILSHDGYRLVERCHNPEKWVNVDVMKKRPDGSLVGGMLDVNQLKVRYDLRGGTRDSTFVAVVPSTSS